MADRPSHCTSFPISDPVIHEEGDRNYWCGLYGMNSMNLTKLIQLGRSWAFAKKLSLESQGYRSGDYDRSRRCYHIENVTGGSYPLKFTVLGSKEAPIINPAFHVRNWYAEGTQVLVDGKEFNQCEIGINYRLEGKDLVVFLRMEKDSQVDISIIPE
jgi:hypothetical protein